MAPDSAGEYVALVVRLHADADGVWRLDLDGTPAAMSIPLAPATFVIRLWRAGGGGALRGKIRLDGDAGWAPIQSNTQLIKLIRTWLFGDSSADNE